ncbi:MAG: cytochrome C [Rhodobacterales bacterium]|nr:MAG: cytochrome C [Rhodobacterales bacterium]
MKYIYSIATILTIIAATSASAQDVDEGRVLYDRHCATCHGIDATGHGPMAGVLAIKPTNLTTLKSKGAEFPLTRVIKRIDGRDPLVSHGSPMPVYGDFFEGDDLAMKTATGQPIMTSRAIGDLVVFLLSLQQPSE